MTATLRDSICQMGRMEIPRPEFKGMQFVATRGKMGFYRTIRANGAQYGLQMKQQPPRRPALSSSLFQRPDTVKEEDSDDTISPPPTPRRQEYGHSDNDDSSSSQMSNYSVSPQPPSPVDLPPDYPDDYVPIHLRKQPQKLDSRFIKRYQ
ncbi:unnamed protein product [Auanema sp. JU1783]|nr:unnamed protein product [Auanema sp. JU1783]